MKKSITEECLRLIRKLPQDTPVMVLGDDPSNPTILTVGAVADMMEACQFFPLTQRIPYPHSIRLEAETLAPIQSMNEIIIPKGSHFEMLMTVQADNSRQALSYFSTMLEQYRKEHDEKA